MLNNNRLLRLKNMSNTQKEQKAYKRLRNNQGGWEHAEKYFKSLGSRALGNTQKGFKKAKKYWGRKRVSR